MNQAWKFLIQNSGERFPLNFKIACFGKKNRNEMKLEMKNSQNSLFQKKKIIRFLLSLIVL